MNTQEISAALADMARTSIYLEQIYEENGGEITEETTALEDQAAAIRTLLTTEGIDSLGRWLKSKEDEKATYKAEKAAADRRIKSIDKTIDFIKREIGRILRETGQERVKGTFYTFKQLDSQKTTFDAEALDAEYLDLVTEAARNAGLPACIDVALKTSASRLQEDERLAALVNVEETKTCSFTKPKKAEEK